MEGEKKKYFWNVLPCGLIGNNVLDQHAASIFREEDIILMMEEACSSDMLVPIYQITQCNTPGDSYLHFYLLLFAI
jgi:hypothetical protein